MAITRYSPRETVSVSPWDELARVTDRVSRMFDGRWASPANGWPAPFPAVNVEETADELLLTAELPGMDREHVEVEVESNVLTLSGQKMDEREEGAGRRYHVVERTHGAFQRSFALPHTIDPDRIDAHFERGVLFVRMPKLEAAKGRKILIEAGS